MAGTYVNITANGTVELLLDLYYEETGMDRSLYRMETDRIISSAKANNFSSHKHLVLYYFRDRNRIVVDFGDPPLHGQIPWGVPRKVRSKEAIRERQWQAVFTGSKPGVFERTNSEWLGVDPPKALDYYKTFEEAKAVFTSAVRRGDVVRVEKIVTREVVSRGDKYCGQTTDREILASTTEWHAVTVGREPGVFSSESLFERDSTQSNIRGIEVMDIGMVERVSVVHVREVMTENDFPGLIEPWKF